MHATKFSVPSNQAMDPLMASKTEEQHTSSYGPMITQKMPSHIDLDEDAGLWEALANLIRGMIPAVPLPIVVMLLVGLGQLTIGLVTWDSMNQASRANSLTFSRERHRETVAKMAKDLQARINTAERLVRIQRSQWEQGIMCDDTVEKRQHTFRGLLDMIITYKDSVSAIYYTSRTMGLNGYYVERTPDGYAFQVWDTDNNGTFFNSAIDPDTGRTFGPSSITPGYNASDEVWVQATLPPRIRSPPVWTKPYGWGTTLWLSLSNPVLDASGNMIAIAGVDFDLSFITSILQRIIGQGEAAQQAANVTTYLFDASGDASIGSSIPANIVMRLEFDGTYRTLGISELGQLVDSRLALVSAHIRSQHSRLDDRPRWSFAIPGYFVETAIINSSYSGSNLKWVLVQLAAEESVFATLATSQLVTKGVIAAAIALSFAIALAVSGLLNAGLRSVQRMLEALARLDFKKAFQLLRFGRARDLSVGLKEVWELQLAASTLALSFATGIVEPLEASSDSDASLDERGNTYA